MIMWDSRDAYHIAQCLDRHSCSGCKRSCFVSVLFGRRRQRFETQLACIYLATPIINLNSDYRSYMLRLDKIRLYVRVCNYPYRAKSLPKQQECNIKSQSKFYRFNYAERLFQSTWSLTRCIIILWNFDEETLQLNHASLVGLVAVSVLVKSKSDVVADGMCMSSMAFMQVESISGFLLSSVCRRQTAFVKIIWIIQASFKPTTVSECFKYE